MYLFLLLSCQLLSLKQIECQFHAHFRGTQQEKGGERLRMQFFAFSYGFMAF